MIKEILVKILSLKFCQYFSALVWPRSEDKFCQLEVWIEAGVLVRAPNRRVHCAFDNISIFRDKDQDGSSKHCSKKYLSNAGWWFHDCGVALPTGHLSNKKKWGHGYLDYRDGGDRGRRTTGDPWKTATFSLVPKTSIRNLWEFHIEINKYQIVWKGLTR